MFGFKITPKINGFKITPKINIFEITLKINGLKSRHFKSINLKFKSKFPNTT